MPDPIVRWQIVSPDPDRTTAFYRALFDWEVSQANGMGYREVRTNAAPRGPVDGGVWPAPPGNGPLWQVYVSVPDVPACVDRAVELGAKVIVPVSVLPDGDTMAVLLDPVGLPFGVCTLRDGQ